MGWKVSTTVQGTHRLLLMKETSNLPPNVCTSSDYPPLLFSDFICRVADMVIMDMK
jgi:hypothetical protein